MPSLKRLRSIDDDDEEEIEVLESASSELRATNKRPHLSHNGRNGSSSRASTAFDEDNPPSTQFRPHGGILEEYERFRDQVSVVPREVDEAYMEQMTQDRVQRKQVQGDFENVPAEQGILESIVCTNFMCHTKLEVKFGPLINFIIGHNGSGKSAVLTAVQLCLGGKATSTNRGQNLKSFIKEGAEQTVLQVKIKNKGDDAYKHETYGDSIIVERHFNTLGTSGFRIKNKDGRVTSTKRSELDDISDFFALQLDNPVNVLTQDMARQFLNSSTPAEKYKFFIKGVQLEQLDSDYSMLGSSLDDVDAQLKNLQGDCESLKKANDKAQEQFKKCEVQATSRELVTKYTHQQAWAQIEMQEQNVSECAARIEERDRRVALLQGKFEDASQHYEQAEQTHEEAEEALRVLGEEKAPLEERHGEAKTKFDDVARNIKSLHADERKVRLDLGVQQKKLEEWENEIINEQERLDSNHGGEEAEKRAEIEQAKRDFEAALNGRTQNDETAAGLKADEDQAKALLEKAKSVFMQRGTDLENAKARLNGLKNPNGKGPWASFQSGTEKLVNAIADHNGFRERPVGPMARHVRLLEPKWSSIVETTLGNSLKSFVVSSKEDHTKLTHLMRKHNYSAPILITSSKPIDVREPAGYKTILKILEIDNHMVRNSLIINQAIDHSAIFEDNNEAMRLASADRMPENVKSITAMHPHSPTEGIRYTIGIGGRYRQSNPVKAWNGPSRMSMSDREAIEAQEDAINNLKTQLHDAEKEKNSCQEHALKASQAMKRQQRNAKDLKLAADRAEERVEDLKAELEALRPQDGQMDFLLSELELTKRQVEHLSNQSDEVKQQKEDIALANKEHKSELDRLQALLDEKEAAITKAEGELTNWRSNKQTRLRVKNEAEEALKASNAERARTIQEHEKEVARLASWTESAKEVSLRVPVPAGATFETIAKQLDRLRKDLEHAQVQLGGTEAELAEKAASSFQQWRAAEDAFKHQKKTRDVLFQSLTSRKDRWKMFRTFITIRARAEFKLLLEERAFRGNLVMDHTNKVLDLQVQPDATSRVSASRNSGGGDSGEGRQTKTLSGGEKSFSTICMLLALWEAMGSPIRCLDEFDVFMDSVNRDISMKMMISAARQSVGRQYILITPQAMGSAEVGSDVRVIRLSDPERGQTVLELPAAA